MASPRPSTPGLRLPQIETRSGPKGTTYRVRIRVDGRQFPVTLPTASKADDFAFMVARLGAARAYAILQDEEAQERGPADAEVRHTVGSWTEGHITQLTGVTGGTRSDYRVILAKDIAPTLADIPLTALTTSDVAAWVNAMDERGLSGKSIRNRHSVLSAALESAHRAGLIPLNVAKGVRLPRQDAKTREATFLTPDEYIAIEAAMKPTGVPLLILLAQTGMRIGEATALRVKDVDLTGPDPVIRVVRAVKHTDNNGLEYGPPKSRAGRRSITLFESAADYLAGQIAGLGPNQLVVQTSRGTPWTANYWREAIWHPAVRASGIGKRPTPHDIRHSHASWLIARGVPLPVIQARLGHDDINTTIRVYGHLTPDLHRGAAAAIGNAIGTRMPLELGA